MDEERRSGGGIGFIGLLTIVFITLRLCGVIRWSWFWVLSPMIIFTTLVILIYAVVCILAARETRGRTRKK